LNGGTDLIALIKGKEVLVVGMARSGIAAAELLAETGAAKITVTDQKKADDLSEELSRLRRYPAVKVFTGGNPPELVTSSLSMIIKSPGVPPSLELFRRAEALGVPVFSEIELAYFFIRAPMIGVTGTNGKTTTTALITAMLKEAGINPVLSAGNIGNPLSNAVGAVPAQGFIVAELSSFQLENISKFRPTVAVFLNFAEDHLDYHGTTEKYFQAKARILENQVKGDYAVLNAGDQAVASLQGQSRGRVLWFGSSWRHPGVGLDNGWVNLYNPGCSPIKICPRDEIALPGEHNLENALAAAAAAWAAGADPGSIGTVLRSFRSIEHRLEHVDTLGGVEYINDSKGTNPGATIKALKSFPGHSKILIAGGKDKGGSFDELASVIQQEVRLLLLIGETRELIARAVGEKGFTAYRLLSSLEEAVSVARAEAVEGDLVLLSPACASWDMFTDYEARGRRFKELVRTPQEKRTGKGEWDNG
jgi:UDP-N-acetylmuramoylalanine--D-glutamate ligase